MDGKEEELLTVSEAAKRLSVSVRTVYRLVERGDLAVRMERGAMRVTEASVKMIQAQAQKARATWP